MHYAQLILNRRGCSLNASECAQQAYPGSAVDVERGMGSMSLHPHGEHAGMVHPGMAMPGYGAIPVPFAYVPTAGGIPQPMPHLQARLTLADMPSGSLLGIVSDHNHCFLLPE